MRAPDEPPLTVRPPLVADKSSLYMDPTAEAERLISSNHIFYGFPKEESYLADSNRTWGNLRQTACTRPSPGPKFYPPVRDSTPTALEAATYTWSWPKRETRAPAPQIQRCVHPIHPPRNEKQDRRLEKGRAGGKGPGFAEKHTDTSRRPPVTSDHAHTALPPPSRRLTPQ